MLIPKSLFDLILPSWIGSSFEDNNNKESYPFLAPLNLGDHDVESARVLIADVCRWLDITIGAFPKWSIDFDPPAWWGNGNEEITMNFLFKTEEDAVAFKLRWM